MSSRVAIEILDAPSILRLKRACQVASQTLEAVAAFIRPGITTAQIDQLVRQDTASRGGHPSQLGYHGFPAAVCTSVNEVVCHGIPNKGRALKDGDIINVDITTQFDGFHGDTSRTFLVGHPSEQALRLVKTTQLCLEAGIGAVRPGARIGDIGHAIERVAHRAGCSVVREFCGHGIGRRMHMEPEVPHFGQAGRGVLLRPGMAFTIEPMINLGKAEVRNMSDGWTVVTRDGSLSAQFEHTVLVTHDGCEVLT
jgi:methionyl aminopeptidase